MNKFLAIGLMLLATNAIAKHDSGCGCGSKPPAPAPAPTPAPAPAPTPSKGSITTPTQASGGSWKPWNDPQLCSVYPQMCSSYLQKYEQQSVEYPQLYAPVEYKLAEPPHIVYVDRTVEVVREVEVPVITTVEIERVVEKIVEVPVYIHSTTNVCPAVPAKKAIISKRVKKECK